MDSYTLQQSNEFHDPDYIFKKRQYVSIGDSNGGYYPNGEIKWDLSSIANADKVPDFSQSFVQIPLVVTLSGIVAADGNNDVQNCYALTMKNHSHLIDSLKLTITNYDVVNVCSNSNYDIHYQMMTSWDENTLHKMGPILGVYKDTSDSILPVGVADPAVGTLFGVGEVNNSITDALFAPATTYGSQPAWILNKARIERMRATSLDLTEAANNDGYISEAQCINVHKNYCKRSATGVQYYIMATIRLVDIHDIFKKLPLTRGIYMNLSLYTNCVAKCDLTLHAGGDTYISYVTSSPHNTFPVQISPIGRGLHVTGGANLSIDCAIAKSSVLFNGNPSANPMASQCRLYACMYKFTELAERAYFTDMPVKQVIYNERSTFQINNITVGGQISQIISNGIARIRSILIVPQLSASIHGSRSVFDTAYTGAGIRLGSTSQSPFSSSPSTTCPHANLTQFNVLIGGSPHYSENINYTWQNFLYETKGSNSLNGGLSDNLCSGLINYEEWMAGYHYIYVDLSRKESIGDDNIARSIEIRGTNSSNCIMDYVIIVNYSREINISTTTGELTI